MKAIRVITALIIGGLVGALMIGLEGIIGIEIGILIGWFPLIGFFTTMAFYNYKDGYIKKPKWYHYAIGIVISFIVLIIGNMLKLDNIPIGFLCGLSYDILIYVVPKNEKIPEN